MMNIAYCFIVLVLAIRADYSWAFAFPQDDCLDKITKQEQLIERKNSNATYFKIWSNSKITIFSVKNRAGTSQYWYQTPLKNITCKTMVKLSSTPQKLALFSTTYLPIFAYLNKERLVNSVSGVGNIYSRKFSNMDITELGVSPTVESVMSAGPDLILGYSLSEGNLSVTKKLLDLNLPAINIHDFLEANALGRSEWLVFISYLIGDARKGEELFSKITMQFNYLSRLVKNRVKVRPKVLIGQNINGTWFVPGGHSDIASLVHFAGADYIFSSNEKERKTYSFEEVFRMKEKIDFWLPQSNQNSFVKINRSTPLMKLLLEKKRFEIFNITKKMNSKGGNDYWETGVMRPDLLLGDLIKIFHPNIVSEKKLHWYERI